GPFARLQGALDINLRALAQVFLGDRDEVLVEDHDAVPFGALAPLARGPVAPALRRREVQIGDAGAVIGRADLGVAAKIADEDHLVDAASHGSALSSSKVEGTVVNGPSASYQSRRMFLLYSYPHYPQAGSGRGKGAAGSLARPPRLQRCRRDGRRPIGARDIS